MTWGPPKASIGSECHRRGADAVVAGCVALTGGAQVGDAGLDAALLFSLAGPSASKFLDGGDHQDVYWLRVWGLRGLLWAWSGSREDTGVVDAISRALRDDAWRVREMAAKVVARHLVGDLLTQVAQSRHDPVPRVAAAAERAVISLTQAGA